MVLGFRIFGFRVQGLASSHALFKRGCYPPIMENRMEKNMENDMGTSFRALGFTPAVASLKGIVSGFRDWGVEVSRGLGIGVEGPGLGVQDF